MSIICGDSVGLVQQLSWSLFTVLCLHARFDSDWRLHVARSSNCTCCSSFPGNDFSGRWCRLGKSEDNVGKECQRQQRFCRADGMPERGGEVGTCQGCRYRLLGTAFNDFLLLISDILLMLCTASTQVLFVGFFWAFVLIFFTCMICCGEWKFPHVTVWVLTVIQTASRGRQFAWRPLQRGIHLTLWTLLCISVGEF